MIPRLVQQITYWPIYLAFKVFFCFRVEGQENLKGLEDKPVIFTSNHASYIDGLICAVAMPREGIVPKGFFPARFLTAEEAFRWVKNFFPFPLSIFVAVYVRANGSIPVIRGLNNIQKNLKKAVAMLNKSSKIWVHPEGKKTKDGLLQKGKKGTMYLYQTTGAPIVPVALIGTFKMAARFLRFQRPRVTVRIGAPMHLPAGVSLEEGTEIIMKEIEALLGSNSTDQHTMSTEEKAS